jgi:uncharacterized protein YPO0396
MPFAGELLQVRDDERDWEGAGERLLHNFGLSLLIPDDDYAPVAEWVDRTQLRVAVWSTSACARPGSRPRPATCPACTATRWCASWLVKPDSPYYDWLERELAQRFDHVACCADARAVSGARRKAITRAGQIKAPGERHEKDDRHRLDDRTSLRPRVEQRRQDQRP